MTKWLAGLVTAVILSFLLGSTVFSIPPQGAARATSSDASVSGNISGGALSSVEMPKATPSDLARPDTMRPDATWSDATWPDATLSEATPVNARPKDGGGLVLDENSIIVYDYSQLKQALSGDNSYTTIYLGDDIVTDAAGIVINPAKTNIVIDGMPPGEEQPYTLTQFGSTNSNYTIRIESSNKNTKEAILRNLVIEGRNYYGIISVWAEDVLLVHDNVDYRGPQPVYNRGGTTCFINSTYLLQPAGGITANELAETKHAEFEGVVTVDAPATVNSILYLVNSASSLTLREEADVTVNTNYYFIYTGGYTPVVSMEAGSRLSLTSSRFGMTYADQRIKTLVMAEDAELIIDLKTPESYAALRISQLFQMEPDSRLSISRTGTAGIALRFTNAGARGVFHQPGRVLLYSSAGVPLRFTGAGSLEITTSALNIWKEAGWPPEMNMDHLPDHIWNKAGTQLLTVAGTYTEAVNTRLDHNLTETDPVSTALNSTAFNLEKNQLVTFGAMELSVDEIQAFSEMLSGNTAAQADILAQYYSADGQLQTVRGTAGLTGTYQLPVAAGTALKKDSTVQITALREDLFIRQRETVKPEPGRLQLVSVPERILFEPTVIPDRETLINRREDEPFRLEILDSREEPTPWRLDIQLEEPLGFAGAMIYKSAGSRIETISEVPVTVYSRDGQAGGEYTLSWPADEGILMRILPGNTYSDREYQATINWSLVDAP